MRTSRVLTAFALLSAHAAAQNCGRQTGTSCSGTMCCSVYGWCGSGTAWCGVGCQTGFGRCTSSSPSQPSTSSSRAAASSAPASSARASSAPASSPTASVPSGNKPVSTDGQCQVNGAACPTGQCCSQYGWCGTQAAYCATGCQVGWGNCNGSPAPVSSSAPVVPPSPVPSSSRASSPSPVPSSSPVASPVPSPSSVVTQPSPSPVPANSNIRVIEQCTVPNTVAITFDDGPYIYTAEIVSAFNAAGGKVTFFMNGNNWDCIYDQATAVKAAFDAGHQIGSHTWSHADLATLNAQQITDEMNKLSAAFKKILGAVPVYMRPPYGSYNSLAQTTLTTLGFKTLAMWDIDSDDSAGASIAAQQKQYTSSSTGVSHNFLNHETYETTARTMVPWIINWAKGRGLKMVTVGECLGDAPANWYKDRVTAETKNPTWVC